MKYFRFGDPRVAVRQINTLWKLMEAINRHLRGWATYARQRLTPSVRRRSQRPLRPPEGVSSYELLTRLGLVYR